MLDDLVLLRLLAAADAPRSAVRDDVLPLLGAPSDAEGRQAFAAAVERLLAAGLAAAVGTRQGRMRLTDAGRAHVHAAFQVPGEAGQHRWAWWRDHYAVPRALNVRSSGTADALRVAMLRRFFLPELPPGTPFAGLGATVDLVLARHLGAAGGRVADLRRAALRAWINGPPPAPADGRPTAGLPDDPAEFAGRVREAARRCESGRFGENKVFLSHVWAALLAAGQTRAAEETAFKERLLRANTAGLLRLSRADLAGAHDPRDVRASEVTHLGEAVHFLRLD